MHPRPLHESNAHSKLEPCKEPSSHVAAAEAIYAPRPKPTKTSVRRERRLASRGEEEEEAEGAERDFPPRGSSGRCSPSTTFLRKVLTGTSLPADLADYWLRDQCDKELLHIGAKTGKRASKKETKQTGSSSKACESQFDDCLTVRLIKIDERHKEAKTISPQSQFEETDQRTVEKCPSSGGRVKLTPLPKLKQPSRDPLVHKQACLDPAEHFTSLSAYDLPPYKVAGTIPVSLGPPDESNALSKLESWKGASSLLAAARRREAIYGPRPSMPANPHSPKTKALAVVPGCKQQIEIQALLEEEGERNARMEALRRMGATLNAPEEMAAKMEEEHLRIEEKEMAEVCVSE
jgi:hypothetical protein